MLQFSEDSEKWEAPCEKPLFLKFFTTVEKQWAEKRSDCRASKLQILNRIMIFVSNGL